MPARMHTHIKCHRWRAREREITENVAHVKEEVRVAIERNKGVTVGSVPEIKNGARTGGGWGSTKCCYFP